MTKEFKRKAKPKVFQRRYRPRCWVCHQVMYDLIDLHEWEGTKESKTYEAFQIRVTEKTVLIIDRGVKRYRHNRDSCEIGGIYFMQNEVLVEKYKKDHKMEAWRQ